MLGSVVHGVKLRNVAFFKDFSEDSLNNIAAITSEQTFPPNTAVFREGDYGDALYIVKCGRVAIKKRDRHGASVIIATYSEGEVIGDMALIDDQPRSASLMTLEETTFYIIQGSHFQLFLYGQRDVTRSTLMLLTQRIRKANERLIFNALDDHPDMVILTDQNFLVSHVNKEAQQKFGISADLSEDSWVLASLKVLLGKIQKQAPEFVPMTWILLKPERLYLGVHVSPMETETGAIFGYLLEFRDVTRDRDRARRNLEVASFIVHRISALAEHINTSSATAMCQNKEPDLARAISEEALLHQIDKLVAFTDMEAGPLRIDRDLADPETILKKIGESRFSLAKLKQQTLDFHFKFGEARISADTELLGKLFSLLIDNAIRYSPSGATISIGTFQTPAGGFCCHIDNPIVGTLNEHDCEKFFDLGKQLDEFEDRSISEFGLDLPLARHIVEAHHGKIHIEPNLVDRFSIVVEIP
ncbi:MAG: cyclic nucleotide-binding domain-containing protein [Candidatus Riflebacteria bacterium]|nr:cyclic nucleotide-binding domain-containing protein [Candidatus Riflebacteria bacterium]